MTEWGGLKVQVNPGSAALFLAAEEAKTLSRIAKLPNSKVGTADQTFWLKHPLTELAMAPQGTEHLDRIEKWLRTLARDWPVSVEPTPRRGHDPAGGMELDPRGLTHLHNANSWAEQAYRDFMEQGETPALISTIAALRDLIRYLKEQEEL